MCHHGSVALDGELKTIKEEFSALEFDSGRLFVSTFRPAAQMYGSVLVLSDIFGRSPFYRMIGRRLAAAGFHAVVPEMFSRLWPVADGDEVAGLERAKEFDQRVALKELESCIAMLRETGDETRVGVLGFCLGGSLAMLLASRHCADAGVIYYGITERRPTTEFAPFVVLDEIEKIRIPLLGFWGENDQRVSTQSVLEADECLKKVNTPREFVIYPELPHGFLTFESDEPAFEESSDSWSRTLTFLKMELSRR
jgi:carboxymethylenebutenolidase